MYNEDMMEMFNNKVYNEDMREMFNKVYNEDMMEMFNKKMYNKEYNKEMYEIVSSYIKSNKEKHIPVGELEIQKGELEIQKDNCIMGKCTNELKSQYWKLTRRRSWENKQHFQ